MIEPRQIVALALFFAAYLGCGGGALWFGRGKKQTENHALKNGISGEQRVERALSRAGYTVLTDLTVRQGKGTHQIDHIVFGQDRLYVLDTKTWHGTIEGRAGQGRAGQGRAGQGRAGQGRAGQGTRVGP